MKNSVTLFILFLLLAAHVSKAQEFEFNPGESYLNIYLDKSDFRFDNQSIIDQNKDIIYT